MPQSSIFRWQEGTGWLVLSGGGDFRHDGTLDIDSHVLSRTVSHGPLAYLWSAGDIEIADLYLEYWQELGGRTGYLLDVLSEDEISVSNQLEEAGIIILGDGSRAEKLLDALQPLIVKAFKQAYLNGATIYAQGRMAAWLSSWIPVPLMSLRPGLGWIENALVAAPYDDDLAEQLKRWLRDDLPDSYGIGIGAGAALALSGDGTVEIWGDQAVTILLGKNLSPD